jgi:hypothetical protein
MPVMLGHYPDSRKSYQFRPKLGSKAHSSCDIHNPDNGQ